MTRKCLSFYSHVDWDFNTDGNVLAVLWYNLYSQASDESYGSYHEEYLKY